MHSRSGIRGKLGALGEDWLVATVFWFHGEINAAVLSPLINCLLANEGFFLKGSYFLNQWSLQEITINIVTISHLFPLWFSKMLTTLNVPKKIKIRNTMKRNNWTHFPVALFHPPRENAMCSPTSALILDRLTRHRLTFCQTYQKHSQFEQYLICLDL